MKQPGDQHADRDIFNIDNKGTVTVINQPVPQRSRSESLLLQAVKNEVTSRLDQSLHNAVLIQLGKLPQPNQVNRPWTSDIKIGDRPAEPIPDDTPIVNIFEQAHGKLLILGAPGSGKTTTMLDLAKALIEHAEQQPDCPIPVLFNLSTWKDNQQSMQDWLIAELKSKYGVRKDIGTTWVENRQLLPLLDGLDELEAIRQESCTKAINHLLGSDARPQCLVVCSRVEEYNTYTTNLRLNGAICLRELNDPQIQDYLTASQHPELWKLFQTDSTLLELVRKPLLLSISVLAGQELAAEQWHTSFTQERLQQLLDAYVRQMMTRELKDTAYKTHQPPNPAKIRRWLVYLARQLKSDSQTEFLIERMQPSWLTIRQQKSSYRLIFQLINGLAFGLIGGLINGLFFELINGLFFGLMGGLMIGLMVGLNVELDRIEPTEAFQISLLHDVQRIIFRYFLRGLIIGLIIGLLFGLMLGLNVGLVVGLSVGLIRGLIGGLIVGLIHGLKVDLETCARPNQGIWNSAKNAVALTVIALVAAVVLQALLGLLLASILTNQQIASIIVGVIPLLIWFSLSQGGGLACIQHFALRVVLFRSGAAPWNYARFLNYCTERLFLQRVGGRYRFIHRLLQEHFAAMPLDGEQALL